MKERATWSAEEGRSIRERGSSTRDGENTERAGVDCLGEGSSTRRRARKHMHSHGVLKEKEKK